MSKMIRSVTRVLYFIFVFALVCEPVGARGGGDSSNTSPNALSALGVNPAANSYYVADHPFSNIMDLAKPWNVDYLPNEVDENGYPLQINSGDPQPLALMLRDLAMHNVTGLPAYPAGTYRIYYDGEGSLSLHGDCYPAVAQPSQGYYECLVTTPSDKGVWFKITQSTFGNHVRNIRVIKPGYENTYQTQTYTDAFLANYEKFKVIRNMGDQRTNNSNTETWDQRARKDFYTQGTDAGVAIELLIERSNVLKADAWFCMPHKANDDYIRNFAELVKEQLDPDLKVYVEYSNEVWNSQFAQYQYALQQGQALGLGDGNAFKTILQFNAQRTAEMAEIWREVFNNDDRVVIVLGSQHTNPWVTEQEIEHVVIDRGHGTGTYVGMEVSEIVDAVAVGAYFGENYDPNETVPATVDDLFELTFSEHIPESYQHMRDQNAVVRPHGIIMVAYEGGQHYTGINGAQNDGNLIAFLTAANRDVRMYDAYIKHLKNWKKAGGKVFCAHVGVAQPNKYGSWGHKEHQLQPNLKTVVPKFKALLDFIKRHPIWWVD